MQNQEILLQGSGVRAGPNAGSFVYQRAHASAKDIFAKYKLNSATDRDDFTANLTKAIGELS